jgi:hypothetical protein
MKSRIVRQAIFLAGLCVGTATVDAAFAQEAGVQRTAAAKRIVMIEPDVQLMELDAGGILELRADWTKAAQNFIEQDLRAHFAKSGAELVNADRPTPRDIQLVKLHAVVARAILTHMYNRAARLRNKASPLDWTLGRGTNEMRDRYGADYALFIFVRDSYATANRQLVEVFGNLSGAHLDTAGQEGFASLVDLRTGNIVWFNRLISTRGDLRTEGPAQRTVDALIKDMPL